ncbi:tripartite motif containing 35-28 [Denticeps clupeoides]|uniref:Zinc-binding protein A33-like n=1 Tax=Denticeps clupeoides TaxID=299321 RepID=A0AAY4AEZ8_9TELE|nr:tripartite motif-containing protein 35-like [Denticeps clupeoides]
MAECLSDDEMADRPSLIEDDLTCPVCKSLFQNPVLLSCGHSFCSACLESSWAVKKQCPICRKNCDGEQPIPNRSLKSTCESYQKEKGWRVTSASDVICGIHKSDFQLFCVRDEAPICVECVTLHGGHDLMPMSEALPFCKAELNLKISILDEKVEYFRKLKKRFGDTMSFIQAQSEQAEMQIRSEFDRLRALLNTEEESRVLAVKKEEEQKKVKIKEKISCLNTEIKALSELIQSVKREMGAEDLNFLLNFQNMKQRAQWTSEPNTKDPDELINMSKHLGSLGFKIWAKMQSYITCLPVLMDPNTASPWLSMTPDFSSVHKSSGRQSLPDNAERFDPCVFVLGSEGFTAGRHRWDVHVGDNPKWILGVCKESVSRKRKFTVTTDGGVWTIGLSKGEYHALTSPRTSLKVERRPETVRVKLNMEKGEVSFWDLGNNKHLCTYTDKFPEKLFPLFGPGLHDTPMAVLPSNITIRKL